MSIHSRLSNFEKSLRYRELALLWLKTAQGRTICGILTTASLRKTEKNP